MVGDDNIRIGDSEREAAVTELQNHHAAGRLSTDEFNDRMGKALEARTASELSALFYDLPGSAPSPYEGGYGDPYGLDAGYTTPTSTPATWGEPSQDVQQAEAVRPWFAQWWMIIPALVIAGGASGRLWFLVPAMAIWLWVIWPSLHQRRQVTQAPAAPPRPLTYSERDEVILALQSAGEVAAIRRYRQLTGADLYTATMTVRAMNRELGS
ncbi:hypothetical protein BW730_16855 [Tessaracoccus aquimaris]|uniref:DUF1707 domain-containing protein n=1 Tax=Tessaracoccus aquimaris TaxID=1332264 RepID=A0A1Q2CS20_9ACTN|nr:DUF1707 domain-containing protein [Tessaracoccus aquimaris]AQP48916.1 hypothetical protein BW730_16855 [Tessaracoccus aquimaris]